jgi:fucose permease
VVRHEDSAKAQSLVFSMTTMASVFASLVSGALLDRVSVGMTMAVAAAVCVIGAAVAILGIQKKSAER